MNNGNGSDARTAAKRPNAAHEIPAAIALGFIGWVSTSQMKDALALIEKIEQKLALRGYIEATDEQLRDLYHRPSGPRQRPRTRRMGGGGAAGIPSIIIMFGYVLSEAIIREFVHEGWTKAIAPALKTMRKRRLPKGSNAKLKIPPQGINLELWFGVEQVSINIRSDNDDPDILSPLVPEALARARQWLNEKGVTHRYLTYCIRNGQVPAVPMLSEAPVK